VGKTNITSTPSTVLPVELASHGIPVLDVLALASTSCLVPEGSRPHPVLILWCATDELVAPQK
jgi:hypothetical protein